MGKSKHMATRAVSTCTRMMIFGLFLGALAVTSEPTDMHDPGQVEAKLTDEVLPESEWKPVESLKRPARGSDKTPQELQLQLARYGSVSRWSDRVERALKHKRERDIKHFQKLAKNPRRFRQTRHRRAMKPIPRMNKRYGIPNFRPNFLRHG